MGWKRIREHYNIELPIRVEKGAIQIGDPDGAPLLSVSSEGTITKRYRGVLHTGLLMAQRRMEEEPEELKGLVSEPDNFSCSQTVYIVDGWEVSVHLCERLGWPHTTHEGLLMRPGNHHPTLEGAIKLAIEAATKEKMLADLVACTARRELLCNEARAAGILRDLHALQSRLSTVAEAQHAT